MNQPKPFFVHDKAICESATVGAGTRIWAFAHVMSGAHVGGDCNLGENVFVENGASVGNRCTIKNGIAVWDGVTLEDDVFLGPYVVFTNVLRPRAFLKSGSANFLSTRLERGCTIGANATIVCGVRIGSFALVGAGCVVTKDVPAHALVVGNPMRIVGQVCFCGETLDENRHCGTCQLVLSENSLEKTVARFR